MGRLKTFLLEKEISLDHASRFLNFVETHNQEAYLDLQHDLIKRWNLLAQKLNSSTPLSPEIIQDIELTKPNSPTKLIVSLNSEKITSTRYRDPIEVSPSFKIPLSYSKEKRDYFIKLIFNEAENSMKELIKNWKEVFNYEKQGRLEPWFKILKHSDEICLQISLSSHNKESYKTLYSIRIEYGKNISKIKNFDRVYLCNLVKL